MKCICITGAIQFDLEPVSDILQQAGMMLPKPAKRGDSIDITSWHEQALAIDSEAEAGGSAIANPGRFMEQLASDIFVANIKSNPWGWADTRSLRLLDFWLNFDPRLYFVLVCVSPQQMLAGVMSADAETIAVEEVMNAWYLHHQELLRFHHRNPQRSLLVDAHECIKHPLALVECCMVQWKLPLTVSMDIAPSRTVQDSLGLYLAQQLCRDYLQNAGLQNELAATVTRLGETEQIVDTVELSPEQIIAGYRTLRDRTEELQQLQAFREEQSLLAVVLQTQIAALAQERDRLVRQAAEWQDQVDDLMSINVILTQEKSVLEAYLDTLQGEVAILINMRDEQSALVAGQQAEIDQLKKKHDDTLAGCAQQQKDAKSRLEETERENELLLLQFHQVQEELEASFLKNQSSQKQIGDQQNEIAAIAKVRDEQSKLVAEHQAKIDELNKKHDDTVAGHAQQQKDAQQGDIATLTNARDEQSKLAAERQTRIESLIQERDNHAKQSADRQAQIAALTNARDEQSKLAVERQATIDQLAKKYDDVVADRAQQQNNTQTRLKETDQENELLLLQLHQVQEELEHYFLQHQDLQKQQQAAEARWQRMLQRNLDYFDYESIEVFPSEGSEGNATTWRFKNLDIAGRSLPQLEFKTILEYGIVGFVFSRQPGTTGAFIRWPVNAVHENEITIIPVGTRTNAQQRFETLFDLAARDWDFLHKLTKLLAGMLKSPAALNVPAGFPSEVLHNGLDKFAQIIEKIPPTLRYDYVSLKREQVNPDYEHLCLHFENLAFNGNRWPEFEFRLSCANVGPNHFGSHPKLEFPELTGQAPFEAWFIESNDDFGSKLELRFTLPEEMDIAVWQRISDRDRTFIAALVDRVPAMLAALQEAGVQLARPWDDWIKMAKAVQRIITLRITPPPVSAPTALPHVTVPEMPPAQPEQPERPVETVHEVKTGEKTKTVSAKPARTSKTSKGHK